jgi:hypothetical protein
MIAARVDGTGYILQGAHANYTASKVVRRSSHLHARFL